LAHYFAQSTLLHKNNFSSAQAVTSLLEKGSEMKKPAEVEYRAIPGHWEGDLLSRAKNSYMATWTKCGAPQSTPAKDIGF